MFVGHSARAKAVPCVRGSGTGMKQVASLWLLAAEHVLATIGYRKHRAKDRGLLLYIDTDGALLVAESSTPQPPNAVYVCGLRPGIDPVVVAARLRHTASRWRLDSVRPQHEDND